MMNIGYLDALPEVANVHSVNLFDGEKVVFTADKVLFGTEKDRMLGMDSRFTLTNKRIIADNGVGIWTVDIQSDIVNYGKVQTKLLKQVYFTIDLNAEMVFDSGKQSLTGFHFYFKKKTDDGAKFEAIMNNVFK